jgi:hypothetical protein
MKIVILDGHAINPGDLSWDALREMTRACRTGPRRQSGATIFINLSSKTSAGDMGEAC